MRSIFQSAFVVVILISGSIERIYSQSTTKNARGNINNAKPLQLEIGKGVTLKDIVFEAGSATITPESDVVLSRALSTFLENPTIEVEIRGYTDNTGDPRKNLRLSQNRADAVKMWLVKHGIPSARVKGKGYGQADPVASNATPEGRAQNRRIEFFRTK
jgi:outer membrane protein OmpA-like peptidoglycan-associated protein